MISFKQNRGITGTIKGVTVVNGHFADSETGEFFDLADMLEKVYGSGEVFDIKTTQKKDEDIDVEMGGEE